ncbi:hypothetical protein [Aeromonas veronii]|uniref:DUF1281 family ferredoxin-like fold protein n=1 Tax=Aeromonas veronii TaxID=654 RepID=UPI003D21227A
MSNECYNYLFLTGSKVGIRKVIDVVCDNDEFGYEFEEDGEDDEIPTFKTHWGPNVTPLLSLSKQFPKVYFELQYEEPNGDFEGWYEFQNGLMINDFSIEDVSSKPLMTIYKTKHQTIDEFKKGYPHIFAQSPKLKVRFGDERKY